MTSRAKPSFRESERRVIEQHAMRVYMDPTSSDGDRAAAQERLVESEAAQVNWDALSIAERREVMWALDVVGIGTKPPPAPPPTRERLENVMRIAQARWEALVAECEASGAKPPAPFYAFSPQFVAPDLNKRNRPTPELSILKSAVPKEIGDDGEPIADEPDEPDFAAFGSATEQCDRKRALLDKLERREAAGEPLTRSEQLHLRLWRKKRDLRAQDSATNNVEQTTGDG